MKIKSSIFILLAALSVSLNSCYDSKMEWGDPYTHPAAKDMPLPLQEAISRYDVLKAYAPANFKLGAGIGFDMYQSNAVFRNVVESNFTDVTPGNELKQQSLMNAQGVLNFANADKVIAQIKAAGLTVYGHNLVWHSQQQATYLNSLIKGTAVTANMIVHGDFENFAPGASADDLYGGGWNSWGGTSSRQVSAAGEGYNGTGVCLIIHSAGGTNEWDIQATTNLTEALTVGHTYHVEAMMKSSVTNGQVQIEFQGGSATYMGLEPVSDAWTKIAHNFTATNANTKIVFDLGKVPADYYIDNIIVFDLGKVNMITGSDFEGLPANASSDDVFGYGWNSWGGTSSRQGSADGDGYGGAGKCLIVHSAGGTNEWDVQATTNLTEALTVGHTYHVEAMMKSSVTNGQVQIEFQGGSATYLGLEPVGDAWAKIAHDFTATNANTKIVLDLGKVPADYYIDNVIVYDFTAITSGGGDLIPMTDDQKKTVLTDVLTNYITDVVTHYQGTIGAWDVVNEPLDDNGAVRAGSEDLTQTSTFYWSYYLGKDYAVTAFNAARAADPNAKLFINDYGLESTSGAKLQGMVTYVQYIESQGAKVDGIGTQLHMNLTTDTTAIDNMFKTLAATGKLIKISEMDIAIGSASPTADQYATQAYLYRYVVNSFMKNVPAAQQYGITVWGVSDNPDEHVNWIPNDAPCLFDANYARKQAYKGFADGLAGKDVSADFSGELVY